MTVILFASLKSQSISPDYLGNSKKILLAVSEANKLLKNPHFLKTSDTDQYFNNSTYSGSQIGNELGNFKGVIQVKDYWNPLGISNGKAVSLVRINKAKLRRSHASITNTVIHETLHAVDWLIEEKWDYTHDGNSPIGQDNTAAWLIGAIAEAMIEKSNCTQMLIE